MPAVTVSAGYGAGGSVVARRLADHLGYRLLDRAISARIADELHVTTSEAETAKVKRALADRFFGVLAPLAGGVVGTDLEGRPTPAPLDDAATFRARAEAILREAAAEGAVVLGRAGAAALSEEPGVYRVRLFGPAGARAAQAARIEGVDEAEARRRLPEVDAARAQYVRRLYGRDIDDPELYHLHLDTTVLSLDAAAELIAAAYDRFLGRSAEDGAGDR